MAAPSTFPSSLVWWRKKRGFSQLQLAMAAACSQRHVSFLELGRTKPSRDMVLRLSAALDLPLRQSNELLLGAGFAPVWTETNFQAAPLAPVREALDYILEQQEPYPAVVVDRQWNLLQANKGAVSLVEFLVGPIAPGTAINLADALVGPDILRPHLVNWSEVVRYFIRRRRGRRGCRRHERNSEFAGAASGLRGRADGDPASRRQRQWTNSTHALPQRSHGAAALHDHRHARNATGRHVAGTANREFFPDR